MKLALLLFVLLMVAAPAAAVHGQAPQPCTWDTCALRIQAPSLTTPMRLVRGSDNEEVVRLGLMQPAVAPWVSLSDSAVAYARIYDVQFDRGSIISLTGTVIAIAAPILMEGTMQKIAFTGVGIGFSVVGGMVTNRANEALSRSVWWYNRELAR
jgi:hypothetical protein